MSESYLPRRVRVSFVGRGQAYPPRDYLVAPGSEIPTELAAVNRYAADCGLPPYKVGKRHSVYYSRFAVARLSPGGFPHA